MNPYRLQRPTTTTGHLDEGQIRGASPKPCGGSRPIPPLIGKSPAPPPARARPPVPEEPRTESLGPGHGSVASPPPGLRAQGLDNEGVAPAEPAVRLRRNETELDVTKLTAPFPPAPRDGVLMDGAADMTDTTEQDAPRLKLYEHLSSRRGKG